MLDCSACDKEKDAELRDFLAYVKNNKGESCIGLCVEQIKALATEMGITI